MPRTHSTVRVSLTVTLTAAIALAVSGCGNGGTTVRAEAESSAVSDAETTETATPTPTATELAPVAVPQPTESFAPFTGPGVEVFGQDAVRDAYVWATDFIVQNTFDDTLIRKSSDELRQIDFTLVEQGLSPRLAEDFGAATAELEAKGESTSPDARDTVLAFASWGLENNGLKLRQPGSRNVGFGGATNVGTDTDEGRDRLILDFPISGEFLFTDTEGAYAAPGSNVAATYTKNMSLFLIKTSDPKNPWKIDGYAFDFALGDVLPDPKA